MVSRIQDLITGKSHSQQSESEAHEFDDQADARLIKNLKINNSTSTVKKTSPPIDIEANAQKILSNQEEQRNLTIKLTSQLLALFKDQTLLENKDIRAKEAEERILKDYVAFARLINNDESQEEGLGSIGFSIAIVKCALIQRDRINELEYNIKNLQREVKTLIAKQQTILEKK